MKNAVLIIVGMIFLIGISFASAKDAAYIIRSDSTIKQEFVAALDELNLSYDLIYSSDISEANLSDYKLMLLNDEYFSNWQEIPVNNFPALIVNGRNIDKWGWTTRITTASNSQPIHINLNNSYEIAEGLGSDIQVYTSAGPDIYYFDDEDAYNGLEIAGSTTWDSKDIVIAIAREGTNLTKPDYASTQINANSVFFGIKDTEYWTSETKKLFKNSLLWLAGEDTFNITLKQGWNLISLPLSPKSNNIDKILANNPEVISAREYNNTIIDTDKMYNNYGYFLDSISNSILTIKGKKPKQTQNIQLNEGMNLMGITSLSNITLNSLPNAVIEVSRRTGNGEYEIATKYGGIWFNGFELEPGKGYWFKANSEADWSYNPV